MAKVVEEERVMRVETRVVLDMTVYEARALLTFLDPNHPFVHLQNEPALIQILRQLRGLKSLTYDGASYGIE